MPFFIRKKTLKGRKENNIDQPGKREKTLHLGKKERTLQPGKRERATKNEKIAKNHFRNNGMQEDISSEEDEFSITEKFAEEHSSDDETHQEKRLRLTKKYLDEIRKEESQKTELAEVSRETISQRLKEDALEQTGQLQRKIAHQYKDSEPKIQCILKGHQLSITCLVVSSDEKYVYSASKDCSIIKWCIKTGKKIKAIPGGRKGTESVHCGHTAHILSIAISSDDKFLATGCRNNIINIWNPDTMEFIHCFKGHKGAISGLTFQNGKHQLISASHDRSLKLWNLDEMGYVETLFGHQDAIASIDSLHEETAITSGGRDNTLRIWKIVEESQLVFQGHGVSMDYVRAINKQYFVSGSDDGSIELWSLQKKKPVFRLPKAHGSDPESGEPHWITAISSLRNSDLVASGSQDGYIRLWMCDEEHRKLASVSTISIKGFVNALELTTSGKYLIAGLGQEHRLGRWWRIKEARNVITVFVWEDKS